jgi:hypothetical protein
MKTLMVIGRGQPVTSYTLIIYLPVGTLLLPTYFAPFGLDRLGFL